MARKWSEVRRSRLTDEELEEIEYRVRRELVTMTIQDLRKHRNLTQVQLAEALEVSQPEMSRIESSQNPLLSTVRRFVEALGGELEVTATFPDGERVRLEGL
jgi:transcriptional regulator with XRE-family HTH domain